MRETLVPRFTRMITVAGLALALLAGATAADAQSREGRWEFTLGGAYQLGADLDFEGGSTLETDDELAFIMSTGYNISDSLTATFGFGWAGVDYNANVVKEDGGVTGISGEFDNWNLNAGLLFNLMEGPLTPFIGASIGYAWIDTNIPNGLPSTGCYWDPWWGYICYTDYPTKTESAFTYAAALGLRYHFNPGTFMRLTYTSQWMDLGQATSTPRFDILGVSVGWLF